MLGTPRPSSGRHHRPVRVYCGTGLCRALTKCLVIVHFHSMGKLFFKEQEQEEEQEQEREQEQGNSGEGSI